MYVTLVVVLAPPSQPADILSPSPHLQNIYMLSTLIPPGQIALPPEHLDEAAGTHPRNRRCLRFMETQKDGVLTKEKKMIQKL